jgi:tripeptide aminopeptidase
MRAFDDPAAILQNTALVDSFLECVVFDTQSEEGSSTFPSTAKQLELSKFLVTRLLELGLKDARLDENGYVIASLPGNAEGVIGLCAHVDTAPAFSGTDVKPILHEAYDGTPIALEGGVTIDPAESADLALCRGHTVITADGTTLLGADDKAGIAAILATIEVLCSDPAIPHPTLRICFTPDEEIGRGADHFPMEAFDAPVAFTVDGHFTGEMSYETFSADKATVRFEGVSVHPGEAKNKMVNALTYLGKFLDALPMAETPECTDGRDGFYHPTDASGGAAECKVEVIIRDFDTATVIERGKRLRTIAEALMAQEPKLKVEVEIVEQYRNMFDELSKHPEIEQNLTKAIELAGLTPINLAVRGGTDGSRLTAMGMPTPNIFAGGGNFHGPQEWVSTTGMAACVCTLLNLVQVYAAE